MGGSYDERMLQQQRQQQSSQNGQQYNSDGSGKANDYTPPPLPKSTFPPHSTGAPGKDLMVHPDRLNQVAAQMHADLTKLQATLSRLDSDGAGGGLISGWSTADALGSNLTNAFEGISQFYADLNNAYDTVISNIKLTVSNYNDAETDTTSAAHGVGTQAAPGSLA
jgi:uncharacterized protein YukE